MGKALILSRKEVTERLARTAQYMAGAAVVTVGITWVDEGATEATAASYVNTAYGETSSGRPLGSLPGSTAAQVASAHLLEVGKLVMGQADEIQAAVAKELEGQAAPPPEGVGTELEGSEVEEAALAVEEADAGAHE